MITFKKVLVTLLNVIICFYSYAQLSDGGVPVSFSLSDDHVVIPSVVTPTIDMQQIEKEDLATDVKASGYRFGVDFYYALSMTDAGVWTVLPNGDRICRLCLRAPGASSISCTFDRYHLPIDCRLYAYSPDHRQLLGAFTSRNNQEDNYFAISLLSGDEMILEYWQPASCSQLPQLRLWRVTHGYRGLESFTKSFGDAGDCQVNVRCVDGQGWDNPIHATCAILDGGFGLCTGTLINNARNDGTPYLLTANHCHSLSQNTGTWVFWFNWESPTCQNVTKSPSKNILSGAQLVAYNYQTDFCLLKLYTAPPVSYNPVYCGWSRSVSMPTSGACIHHPSFDVKKISTSSKFSLASFFEDSSRINAWKVFWTSACTESNSSGSALFDQNRRIIGQLWGGASYCGAPSEKMYDYFGRFDLSWDSDNRNTRLRDWLDPDSSNVEILDYYIPVDGIRDIKQNSISITVSPNPCQTYTVIQCSSLQEPVLSVELIDIVGKRIKLMNVVDFPSFHLDVSDLPRGVYVVRAITEHGNAISKLIVD